MAGSEMESGAALPDQGHSYFIPMVDMLAGVVFILVILLAAATLVSRDEFVKSENSQVQEARARADLDAAQKTEAEAQRILAQARQEQMAAENIRLDPRRQMEIAMRMLLDRLSAGLSAKGYQVETSVPEARLSVTGSDSFTGADTTLSAKGQQLAADLSTVLEQELPCLTGRPAGLGQCAPYPPLKLETAEVQAAGTPAGQASDPALATARSLVLMSTIVAARPDLMALRSPNGTGIFSYAGNAKAGHDGAIQAVVLRFQMAVPSAAKN